MELIDVLDEKGNKTGEVKPKPDIHRDANWHKAVHVWFINSRGGVTPAAPFKINGDISWVLGYFCCRTCIYGR